jgi:hypothetical protein
MATQDVYAQCACGSGKKYKFCCLQRDREAARKSVKEAAPPLLDRRMDLLDDNDDLAHEDEERAFMTPARAELERSSKTRLEVDKLVAYVEPLLEDSDGTERFVEDALRMGKVFAHLALRGLPPREEEAEVLKLASKIKMNGEIDVAVMSDLIRAMIRRHREMFPEEHESAARKRAVHGER